MLDLEAETARLAACLRPASDYVRRAEARFDPTAPGAEGRHRHMADVKLAVTGALDFARVVQAQPLLPPVATPWLRLAGGLTSPPPEVLALPLLTAARRLLAFHADPAPLTPAKLAAHFPAFPPRP